MKVKKFINKNKEFVIPGAIVLALLVALGVFFVMQVLISKNPPASSDRAEGAIQLYDHSQPSTNDTLASLKEDPDYQNARTDIAYDELFRNIDNYKGQYVRYTGEVIQVLGEPGDWNLRVNITKDESYGGYVSYDDTVYIFSYSNERLIEDDIIEFTAYVNGLTTYEATFGQEITIPSLTILEHTFIGRND